MEQGRSRCPLPEDQRPRAFGRPLLRHHSWRRRRWDFQLGPNPVHSQHHPEPALPDAPLRPAQPGQRQHLQISCDCWPKGQSDTRYPLIANFNSLGQRVTDLENSPGVDPTADLTVNSLTATAFLQTPLLQSAAADLQIQNATTTIRAEDGTLLASFADGNIGLEQDVTVRSDRTLNATTADFAQFFVGSTAATGAFASSSSVTATQQIERRPQAAGAPVRSEPTAPWLTVQGAPTGF